MSVKVPAIIPDACPCWEWRWTPGVERACAFARPLLERLAAEGFVPDDEGRCPLLAVCKLVSLLPNAEIIRTDSLITGSVTTQRVT